MIELTAHLLRYADEMDAQFREGVKDAVLTRRDDTAFQLWNAMGLWRDYRTGYGFADRDVPLLTPPAANSKLVKSVTPTYGLTIQHVTTRVRKGLIVNACPWAGDCIKVCVLDNGHGRDERVQRARQAKTGFLTEEPVWFAYLLGYELARAQHRHGKILFRPNVNSDVEWERILPSLTGGCYLPSVRSYGYGKNPAILDGNGWVDTLYRLAFSWNENSYNEETWERATQFLDRGGSIAVVTDRRKGEPVEECPPFIGWQWMDADKTDEWIFQRGVIGDLTAKGRARALAGKSDFVLRRYT